MYAPVYMQKYRIKNTDEVENEISLFSASTEMNKY